MKRIEITKAKAFEIDPAKNYIIVLGADMTQSDAAALNKEFAKWGTNAVTVVTRMPDDIKVIEVPKRKEGVA